MVEGYAAIEHAEDTPDPDGPSFALGKAPLRDQPRRPTLGEVDVLVDEHHELVLRPLDAGIEALGRCRTAAEDEQLVGAGGAQARRAAQIGVELGVVVDTGHERDRNLVGVVETGER